MFELFQRDSQRAYEVDSRLNVEADHDVVMQAGDYGP